MYQLSRMQVHNETAIIVYICNSSVLVKWKIDCLLLKCVCCIFSYEITDQSNKFCFSFVRLFSSFTNNDDQPTIA